MMLRKLLILASLSVCLASEAQTVFDVEAGRQVKLRLAATEMTLMKVDGARMVRLKYQAGELAADPDAERNEVVLKPTVGKNKKEVNFFVVTDAGTIPVVGILDRTDETARAVVLRFPTVAVSSPPMLRLDREPFALPARGRVVEYVKDVKSLVLVAAADKLPPGYSAVDVNTAGPPIGELLVFHRRTVKPDSGRVIAQHYVVTNPSSASLRLEETAFVRDGVLAVAMEQSFIEAGAKTEVFVIAQEP